MADGENESNPFSFSKFVVRTKETPTLEDNKFAGLPIPNDSTTSSITNPFSIKNFTSEPKKRGRQLQIIDDDDNDDDDDDDHLSSSTEPNGIGVTNDYNAAELKDDSEIDNDLFDFHTTTPSPQEDSYILENTTETGDAMGVNFEKIDQLMTENEGLRNEVAKIKEEFLEYRQTANRRISGLQKELEKARKKEVDETKALENVVHMVEENLQFTTTRAVKAESTITRLKEELKMYKEGSVTIAEHEKLVDEHNHLLCTIQEKSKSAAMLMRKAAEKTAPHIRQLQSGLASLQFLSEQFEDIGKIAEIPRKTKTNDVT